MIKRGVTPIAGIVAGGALSAEMVFWAAVTALAICESSMVECDILPITCTVASGTLPWIMVSRGAAAVAAHAIGESGMIKCGLCPIRRIVAGGTLSREMVCRGINGVAIGAVGESGVVKHSLRPI